MRQNQKLLHSPYNKLKGFMREKGIVYAEIANLIGVTPTTISQKINGQSDFSLSEAELIKKTYGAGDDIFFSESCENATNVCSDYRALGDGR